MENLLIIGGCHFVNDDFIKQLKEKFKYKKVRKIFTHISEQSFSKSLEFIHHEKEYLKDNKYDIYFQLGNLLFHNSISNILPKYFNKFIPNNINSDLIQTDNNIRDIKKSYKVILSNILRKVLKVLVFPLNIIYVPFKGFQSYNQIKKILIDDELINNNIFIYTPFYSPNYTDKFFRFIGKKIIYILFSDINNITIINLTDEKFDKSEFNDNDIYHLNTNGMNHLMNYIFEKIEQKIQLY